MQLFFTVADKAHSKFYLQINTHPFANRIKPLRIAGRPFGLASIFDPKPSTDADPGVSREPIFQASIPLLFYEPLL